MRQSGVRREMDNSVLALALFGGFDEISLDVFANIRPFKSETGLFEVMESGKRLENVKVRNVDLRGLRYDDSIFQNKQQFLEKAYEIKDKIVENIDLSNCSSANPFILHCHNIPLGKNAALTAAIKLVAEWAQEEKKPLWILDQIHDFAESRPDRIYALQNCTGKSDVAFAAEITYPNLPNVIYAVINSNDAKNLLNIGISKERIFVLPNSINTKIFEKKISGEVKRKLIKELDDFAVGKGYLFNKEKKILLAPLKVLRRKNLAESILILNSLNRKKEEYQLLITLDANSPEDIVYSNELKKFVRKNKLPVIIGLENKSNKFSINDLCAVSEAVITTSVMEGFGFAFHEGWLCNTIVIGRKLPCVTSDFEKNGLDLSNMYENLLINADWIRGGIQNLFNEYEKTVSDLDEESFRKNKIQKKEGVDCVDFSDLSLEMQLSVIEKLLNDPKSLEQLLILNPAIVEMEKLIDEKPGGLIEKNKRAIIENYCLEAKARRMIEIFRIGNSLYRAELSEAERNKKMDNSKVIQKYKELNNIKLLY